MKNIKLIRVMNDYTQLKVQMETGISQSILSKYERGELLPTVENLAILADFYKTSLDFLMDRTDEKLPYLKRKINKTRSAPAKQERF
ncbi:MAG: helix-turn-helix transcriptional regulator [Clostridia bacterium]|nr:helix-turn-helix transcriptional regulator [Clostridia bacterium]